MRICTDCGDSGAEARFKSPYAKRCSRCYERDGGELKRKQKQLASSNLHPININTTDIRNRWLRAMDKMEQEKIRDSLTDIPDLILALECTRDLVRHMEEWVKGEGWVGEDKPPRQIAEQWFQRRRLTNDAQPDVSAYTVHN